MNTLTLFADLSQYYMNVCACVHMGTLSESVHSIHHIITGECDLKENKWVKISTKSLLVLFQLKPVVCCTQYPPSLYS
jgi:hypothetical protein